MKKLLIILCLFSFILKAKDIYKTESFATKNNTVYFKDKSKCDQHCSQCLTHNMAELKDYPYECKDKTAIQLASEYSGIEKPTGLAVAAKGGKSWICALNCMLDPFSISCRYCK